MHTPTAPLLTGHNGALMGVFAHPDDESLLAGGTLARHAAAGIRTNVVTTTWAPHTPRAGELADALTLLGAGPPRMLGYQDARNPASAPDHVRRLCDADLPAVVGRIVACIRTLKPTVVLTHDAVGQLTGHPDHRRTHEATRAAVDKAAEPCPDCSQEPTPKSAHASSAPSTTSASAKRPTSSTSCVHRGGGWM